jgi:hypothetical protein
MKMIIVAVGLFLSVCGRPAFAAHEECTGTLTIAAGPTTRTLTFGIHPDATALRDHALGEREVPPPPPTGVFDARFLIGAEGVTRDIRPPDRTAIHRLRIQSPGDTRTVRISWTIPDGAGAVLRDIGGGAVFTTTLRGKGSVNVTPEVAAILELAVAYATPRDAGALMTPEAFSVHGAYPNPFNPTARISYTLPDARPVRLQVYTITGQLVATLVNGMQPAGRHDAEWDATTAAAGVYVYRLSAGADVRTGRMILLK